MGIEVVAEVVAVTINNIQNLIAVIKVITVVVVIIITLVVVVVAAVEAVITTITKPHPISTDALSNNTNSDRIISNAHPTVALCLSSLKMKNQS